MFIGRFLKKKTVIFFPYSVNCNFFFRQEIKSLQMERTNVRKQTP